MLFVFRWLFRIFKQKQILEKPKLNPIPESFNIKQEKPDFLGFLQFLKDSSGEDSYYKISQGIVLDYGTMPQKFIIVEGKDNKLHMSFYMHCDPAFAAVMGLLAVAFFGEKLWISDSFLYRKDGSICLSIDSDFPLLQSTGLTFEGNVDTVSLGSDKKKFSLN